MNISRRMARLRAMAEHPRTDKNEVELARAELERLRKKYGEPTAQPEPHWGREWYRSVYFDTCYYCHAPITPSRLVSTCAAHRGFSGPGSEGYYEWARSLQVGQAFPVKTTLDRPSRPMTAPLKIVRMTKTQYVMEDGTRFRRSGHFPGYKVGEDGRNGRTYLVRT